MAAAAEQTVRVLKLDKPEVEAAGALFCVPLILCLGQPQPLTRQEEREQQQQTMAALVVEEEQGIYCWSVPISLTAVVHLL